MNKIISLARKLYALDDYLFHKIEEHEGGRNDVYICQNKDNKYVLRISSLSDRNDEDYLAEIEFIHFLTSKEAPTIDVIPSINGNFVEKIMFGNKPVFICLFTYAQGIMLCDNGYVYRQGNNLDEYFYNCGKVLGTIHRLSKEYKPLHKRIEYEQKYNVDYIDKLIPDSYDELKRAIFDRLNQYKHLPKDKDSYGLIHFDFYDGNYHIDMNDGKITVFDFDNCLYCWYMYDLAQLWLNGQGWICQETDANKRREFMDRYFDIALQAYRSECDVSKDMLDKLPLFIDMVLIENIVDEFENLKRENTPLEQIDIEEEANCLINNIPYASLFES